LSSGLFSVLSSTLFSVLFSGFSSALSFVLFSGVADVTGVSVLFAAEELSSVFGFESVFVSVCGFASSFDDGAVSFCFVSAFAVWSSCDGFTSGVGEGVSVGASLFSVFAFVSS
jgi:hypothetical protein